MNKAKRHIITFLSLLMVFAMLTCLTVSADTYYVNDDYKFKYLNDNTAMIAECYIDSDTLIIPDTLLDHNVSSIEPNAFQNDTKYKYIVFGKYFTTISAMCFSGSAIKEVTLPETMETLVWGAFANCSQLTAVTIKDSALTIIPRTCFYNCSNLTTVDLGNNITTIEKYAFSDCISLTSVTIPKATTSIAPSAFSNCPNLTIFGYADSYAQQYATENNIPFVAISEYEIGDVDLNGRVDVKDATDIQRYVAELTTFNETQISVADMNNDGVINVADATDIQKYIVRS